MKHLNARQMMGLAAATLTVMAIAAPAAAKDGPSLTVAGPHVAENLAVYFLRGTSAPGPVPLTLAEGLEGGHVTVRETGEVERLEIENAGDVAVFVQAGDILKGGRQDRVLTVSLLIPPKSGPMAIGSYCVEQGRWSQRAGERADRFASSTARLPSKAARLSLYESQTARAGARARPAQEAARQRPDDTPQQVQRLRQALESAAANIERSRQAEIWARVEEVQRKLGTNLATSVRSTVSGSSLQLSLENEKLVAARDKLVAALIDKAAADDVVGYAFAINGRINTVEVYPSNGLFRKMWPKLLRASVTEAIAERDGDTAARAAPAATAIERFIAEAREAAPETDRLEGGLFGDRRKSDVAIVNEVRKANDGGRVHLSIVAY
jgi:hypothetical protein